MTVNHYSKSLLRVINIECVWIYANLYILESLLFDSELRSKGTLYSCFMRSLLRLRTQLTVERLTLLIPSKCTWSSMIFCWISLSLMALFSRTISTIRVSWCGENIPVLPPPCGSLSILQKENMELQKIHMEY